MLSSLTGFVKRRQRGLAVVGSVAGGLYLAASYARSRFAELSERLVTDRAAKENLRRRFQQAQEDCAFTLLALLPTLSKQVLEELDVEALTAELQRRAEETRKAKEAPPAQQLEQSTTSRLGQSWDTLSGSENYSAETREAAQIPLPDAQEEEKEYLGTTEEQTHVNGSVPEKQSQSEPEVPVDPRTKAELWQAVKILTFQRTITALYLLCLLGVQTHIQLNLLGRHNYVNSVYEQAWKSATSSTYLNGHNGLFDDEALAKRLKAELTGEKLDEEDDDPGSRRIDGYTEQQYLSCTWWLLWKGWRDISERVRIATEEALESILLKTQLGADDLRKLLLEIRRKIEYEPTGACHSFASATFPMSHAAERETLEKSGLGDTSISTELRSLLDETKDFLESPDSSVVLRSCLDRVFSQLSSTLAHLFVDNSQNPASDARFEELPDRKVRLAAVLPALARASHSILNAMPNEFAESLGSNRELQEFSAVVYSNFIIEQ